MKKVLLKAANAVLRTAGVQIYREGMDMESVLKQLAKRAGPIATVVDIGASNGRWSEMSMKLFPQARFIGVDPLVEREPQLKRLKERTPQFDYILCVAGNKDNETVELAITEDLDGSTIGGAGIVRKVPSHSIDEIIRVKKCAGPFILKFDTHGFEVPILKGAAKTMENTRYIVMEVYNYRHVEGTLLFHEMCSLLDGMGFRCFNMADPLQRPLDGCLWQMDLFFARKDDACFRDSNFRRT
jgi:FkbM family methyltransferase